MTYLTLALLAQTALIVFLLMDRRIERREQAHEREMLHQRLQAPELAVQQYAIHAESPPSPVPLGIEDDDLFNETREGLVERLARMNT